MIKRRNYIKNIEEIIKEKLKELELKPVLKLSKFIKENKRFYSAPCINKKGEEVFFKIIIADEISPTEAIKREIKIRNFLIDFKNKLTYPILISWDDKNFPYWFLSQYFEGKLFGHFYNLYSKNDKYISLLIDALFSLHKIPKNSIKKISKIKGFYLWERDFDKYLKLVKEYQIGIEKEIAKKIRFTEIYKLFKEKKGFLEKSPLVFVHGDFTLANFVDSSGKLIIADWEQAHLDNFVYDLSHLWIQLWRYPSWQKKLISEFIYRLPKRKIKEFKEIFRIVIISEALGELRWSINLCQKKYRNGAIRAALKTISASLKGFDNLLNL